MELGSRCEPFSTFQDAIPLLGAFGATDSSSRCEAATDDGESSTAAKGWASIRKLPGTARSVANSRLTISSATAPRRSHHPRRRMAAVPFSSPLQDVNLQLQQGKIYAVVGPHGSGKSALLRLLSKAMHPTRGEVFVPPHLSILHVEQTPQMFHHLSMYDNLTLGYKQAKPSVDAVCEVCASLGLSESWISYLRSSTHLSATDASAPAAGGSVGATASPRDGSPACERKATSELRIGTSEHGLRPTAPSPTPRQRVPLYRPQDAELAAEVDVEADNHEEAEEEHAWEGKLSASDRCILHLSRAFITNPHLLVLHRPLGNFDAQMTERLLAAMREFVVHRGSVASRSKGLLARTVVFTCGANDVAAIEAADGVVVVGMPEGGATVHDASQLGQRTMADGKLESRSAALMRLLGLAVTRRTQRSTAGGGGSAVNGGSYHAAANSSPRHDSSGGGGGGVSGSAGGGCKNEYVSPSAALLPKPNSLPPPSQRLSSGTSAGATVAGRVDGLRASNGRASPVSSLRTCSAGSTSSLSPSGSSPEVSPGAARGGGDGSGCGGGEEMGEGAVGEGGGGTGSACAVPAPWFALGAVHTAEGSPPSERSYGGVSSRGASAALARILARRRPTATTTANGSLDA